MWEELQDPGQEEVLRLDVVGIESDKVKVRQSVLGQVQCPVKQLWTQ